MAGSGANGGTSSVTMRAASDVVNESAAKPCTAPLPVVAAWVAILDRFVCVMVLSAPRKRDSDVVFCVTKRNNSDFAPKS